MRFVERSSRGGAGRGVIRAVPARAGRFSRRWSNEGPQDRRRRVLQRLQCLLGIALLIGCLGQGAVSAGGGALPLSAVFIGNPRDLNDDGSVDENDIDVFESCGSGPGIPRRSGCERSDLDGDGDVDQSDFSILQQDLRGSQVPYHIQAPTIDGVLTAGEWDANVSYLMDAMDTTPPGVVVFGTTAPPSNTSARVHVQYDNQYLYVAVDVTDDLVVNSGFWYADNVQLYVDPDHSRTANIGLARLQFVVDAGGWMFTDSTTPLPAGSWLAAASARSGGYVAEFRLSKSGLGIPSSGTIGFDVAVNDVEPLAAQVARVDWYFATAAAETDESLWGDLILQSALAKAPVIAAIANQSIAPGPAYSYTPSLTQGSTPVTWSLVSGPSGMVVNPGTGVVSWSNPTTTGSPYSVTIRATNSIGSGDRSWMLTVAQIAESAVIGIPMPEFGIAEVAPTYNPTDPLHYYVDNTVPGATDSANPKGGPAKPRVTIPGSLPAGAYVEVHGGPYAYGSGYIQITGQGTAANPIFIVGVGMPRIAQKVSVFGGAAESRYMVFHGLSLYKWECAAPASYIVLRNCDLRGDASNGGAVIASFDPACTAHHILIRDNTIHDNGDWLAEYDQDVHGVVVTARCNNIWILDNEMYHNSGDGLQINAASLQDMPTTHHIYVGRNLSYENKQSGLWTKQATDVIFSQNVCHTLRPIGSNPSAYGPGLGFQYGPERVWFLYNHVYNCCYGISSGSTSGQGNGQDVYLIGNLIHDIHYDAGYAYNPGTAWSNAGIMLVGTVNKYLVNNTIYDSDAGINTPSGGAMLMENNIISNITDPQGNHVFVEDGGTAGASLLEHCVLYQNGNPIRIRWGNGTVRGLPEFQAAFGKGLTCVSADPQFADPSAGDFRPLPGSPAVGGGIDSSVYDIFLALYGLDIRTACTGPVQPPPDGCRVGALCPIPPPASPEP